MSTVADAAALRQIRLDPNSSVIVQATEWLVGNHTDKNQLDLSDQVIALPTARAGRRLLESIVFASNQRELVLSPPTMATVGRIPEYLYPQQYPLASDLMQRLAWTSVLADIDAEDLQLISAQGEPNSRWAERFSMAGMIQKLHQELAGNLLSFRDVLDKAVQLDSFREHDRWQLLHRLQMAYFKQMRDAGMWDIQTARRMAVLNSECRTEKSLILIGTVDLNQSLRHMLVQVHRQVTLLTVCDETTSQGLDALGCLRKEFWRDYPLRIADDRLRFADRPHDQARILVDFVARLDGKFAAEEIAIAVPDSNLIPTLTRFLKSAGAPTHDATGETLDRSGPIRLFRLLAQWARRQNFADLARLVRHEAVFDKLTELLGTTDWLPELDRIGNRYLPARIQALPAAGETALRRLVTALSTIVGEFSELQRNRRLSEWAVRWRELIDRCYGHLHLDSQDPASKPLMHSLRYLNQILSEMEILNETWDIDCSAEDSLLALLTQVSERMVVMDRDAQSIELLGWLDMIWDDAPVAIVTNFNEGNIPSSKHDHPFLPNSLRSHLGLMDNDLRYARDKFALTMLLENRQQLLLISGRRDELENPLLPSRLAFTGEPRADAVRWLKMIYRSESRGRPIRSQLPRTQQFRIPELPPIENLDAIHVTDFDAYLNCPYRFYLQKILRLQCVEDRVDELDHRSFGTLAHDVLEAFGHSELKDSTDVTKIRKMLKSELAGRAKTMFGSQPLSSIQIQISQLELRLEKFAEEQVRRRRAGWRIEAVEYRDLSRVLDVDGQPIRIKGRLDRLDRNQRTGEQAIIDYKTGRKEASKQFNAKSGWKSLQLPLYQWMFAGSDLDSRAPIFTGYARLCQDLDAIAFDLINWQPEQIEQGINQAVDVVHGIRANDFAPNPQRPFEDEFDGICQNKVFEKWGDPSEEVQP